MKQQMQEEQRAIARAEREALELAECTFKPQTTPLPAYLMRSDMLQQQDVAHAGARVQLQFEEASARDAAGMEVGQPGYAAYTGHMQQQLQHANSYTLSGMPTRSTPKSDAGLPPQWEQRHQAAARIVASEGGARSPGGYSKSFSNEVGETEYGVQLGSMQQPVVMPAGLGAQHASVGDLAAYKQRLIELQAQLMLN